MSPRKLTSARQDQVVRVKLDVRLVKMMKDECVMENIEPADFLRRLISYQMGTMGVSRAPASKKRRPLTGSNFETESIVVWMTTEMYDFFAQLSNRCGCTKTALFAIFLCDYFEILPIKFLHPPPTQ